MNVRFSTCIGTPIVCDSLDEVAGQVFDILIHPDTGAVEGFFVLSSHTPGMQFLASMDIVRWGTQVHIQHLDSIYPLEDRIRLQPLMEDKRNVLHQRMRTESGHTLGRCKDVQFNTKTMKCEWLFPRKWWKWCAPIPLTDVVEIQKKYIIIKDALVAAPEQETEEADSLTEVLDAALPDIAPAPKAERR